MSAGASLDQLKLALAGNVWYLDGGWQTLVDGLREQAAAGGAEFRTRARVDAVHSDGVGVTVRLAEGEELHAPGGHSGGEPGKSLRASRRTVQLSAGALVCPKRADSGGLPRPGIEPAKPTRNSLCAGARSSVLLFGAFRCCQAGPGGRGSRPCHEVPWNRYERCGSVGRARAGGLSQALQPGWKEHLVARRFLPSLTVAHSSPFAHDHGLSGRPGVALTEHPHVFLAGDWVGPEGMLADASAASAAESARRVRAILSGTPAAERGPLHVTS